jgi:hypothetical protein
MENKIRVASANTGDISAFTADFTTYEQIVNAIRSPVIIPVFRLYAMAADEFVRYEIPADDVISISWNENYNNGSRRTLDIKLVNNDGRYSPNISGIWGDSRIRFDAGVDCKGGRIWFRKGVYIISDISENISNTGNTVSINLQDKFGLFMGNSGRIPDIIKIPAGSICHNVVQSILSMYCGNSTCYDSNRLIFDGNLTGFKVPHDLIKNEGGAYGEILLDIANFLNADCFYSEEGCLCYFRVNENLSILDNLMSQTLWRYRQKDLLEFNMQNNFENIVNRVIVISNNANVPPCCGISEITNGANPYCIGRIGERTLLIQDDVIYSNSLAKQRADYELRKASIKNIAVTVKVVFNPIITCGNLIEIDENDSGGRRIRYFVQSVSFNSGDGTMDITCSNIDELPQIVKAVRHGK